MLRKSVAAFFFLLGLALMGAAIFATALGLDHNSEWGRGRIAALIFGVLIAWGGVLVYRHAELEGETESKIRSFVQDHPLTVWMRQNRDIAYLSNLARSYRFTFPLVLFVLIAYVWFISVGLWTTWPSRTSYYAFLAQGFRRGNLSLSIQPDPRLVKLPDPYDPVAREVLEQQGIRAPSDLSLYKGKFYLYFGPVPAVVLAVLRPLFLARITDLYLVFGFVCGLFLSQFLLLLTLWDRFFRGLPKWMLFMSVLVVGWNVSSTIPLNNPSVYEAAISGGQFFLMGGFLLALSALDRPSPSGWQLALAGILWACSIGTRLTLILPVGFLVLMVAYRIFGTNRLLLDSMKGLIPLLLPLMCGAIYLGWYNWARFGSIFETGFSYALAGVNLQKSRDLIFSPMYILQNLYNYLLYPPAVRMEFPFFFPGQGNATAIFSFYPLPAFYTTEPVMGWIYTAPFALFGVVPITALTARPLELMKSALLRKPADQDFFKWIIVSLGGTFLLAFLALLTLFYASVRYIEDFMPALVVLSIIGFWYGYKLLCWSSVQAKFYSGVALVLAGLSIVIAWLLAISANIQRFQIYNPALLDWLIHTFPR